MELNHKNYFSKEAEALYMGSSSFKAWDIFHGGCEAKQLAIRNGEYTEEGNDAFLLGSYVHAWNQGELDTFIIEHPELFSSRGATKGQLLAKYAIGDKMIDVLKRDPLVQKFREGAEKEVIFTGQIDGVDFKIQVDILNIEKGYFADLKTTKDLSATYWNNNSKQHETFIEKYDYFTQFAIYAEILRQNLKMDTYLRPYVIAVDKTAMPDHEIIDMGTSWIPDKLEEIKSRLPRIMSVRNGLEEPIACGKCDYCKSIKKARVRSFDDYKKDLL